MSKTHWKKLHNPDYLGAYALGPGEELVATIKSVGVETVIGPDGKKEECTVVHFSSPPSTKPMILNVTNSKTIEKLYGSPYVEDWEGKAIQIYATRVKAFGEVIEALRIRTVAPVTNKPDLNPNSEKWADAVIAISEGRTTIVAIKSHYSITPQNELLLCPSKDI